MINPKRVRRIKNVIYAIIVILLFLPAIFMIVMGIQFIRALNSFNASFVGGAAAGASSAIVGQGASQADNLPGERSASGDSGYVIDVQPSAPLPGMSGTVGGAGLEDAEPDDEGADGRGEPDAQPLASHTEDTGAADGAQQHNGNDTATLDLAAPGETAAGNSEAADGEDAEAIGLGDPSVPAVRNPNTGLSSVTQYRMLAPGGTRVIEL